MSQENTPKDGADTVSVNGVPPEWLVHYAEMVEERGDSDLAERVRELIQESTGLNYQEVTSQFFS